MTLTIELTSEQEVRLKQVADRYGIEPKQYILNLVEEGLKILPAPISPKDVTAALFARWKVEDGMDDPEEIAQAEAEWNEMKANLEANRLSLPVPKV